MKIREQNSICHLTSVHPPFDIRIFHKECQSLVKAGYAVSLIAPDVIEQEKGGVNIVPIQLPKSRINRMFVVTLQMFKKALKTKAKLFHFHDPELMICGILLRLSGKKVIFDIHENVRLSLISKDWLPKAVGTIMGAFYFLFERFALLFYHRLILAEESYLIYYPHQKSVVVLNYPLLAKLEIEPKSFTSPVRFIYSGVVHQLRGVWEMLELIKGLNNKGINARLDLLGEVRPKELVDELQQYISENQLNEKVRVLGKVPYLEVAEYLKNADIGLSLLKPIPNYVESLPTKIFEYMQYSLPVITNDFPLYKKYVEAEGTGINVAINNKEELLNKVYQFSQNRERLKQASEKGPDNIQARFNWQTQEKILLDEYAKLLQ